MGFRGFIGLKGFTGFTMFIGFTGFPRKKTQCPRVNAPSLQL